MSREIGIFKRKLTNLSAGNPLLWMGRLRSGIHLDLSRILFQTVVPEEEFFNQILSGKKKIKLAPVYNPRNTSENKIGADLQRLARLRKIENQERGTDHLFLAWPFVSGRWPDGSPLRTPFQLLPLNLYSDGKFWFLEPEISRAIINPAFMLAYAYHSGKPLDTQLFEKELDIEADDARSYLTQLYEKVSQSLLDLNFNSALFSLKLESFLPMAKAEFPPEIQAGSIRLEANAAIGLFSLSDSLLLPDFEELERRGNKLEDLFLSESDPSPSEVSEEDLLFPLPVDGSQEDCLREILAGKSLVVEGPPGSGKSQLITNLAASAAASGKSVLIVCQKKVALEVVLRRLQDLGIGSHAGMWADYRNDVSGLYAALAGQIEALEETEQKNRNLDTVMLERDYQRLCREISRICAQLEEWKSALFREDAAGISLYALRQRHGSQPEENGRAGLFLKFPLEDWEAFRDWLLRYGFDLLKSRQAGTLLRDRGIWNPDQVPELLRKLQDVLAEEDRRLDFLRRWQIPEEKASALFKMGGPLALRFPAVFLGFEKLPAELVLSDKFRADLGKNAERLESLLAALKQWPSGSWLTDEEFPSVLAQLQANPGIHPVKLRLLSFFSKETALLQKWFSSLKKAGFASPQQAITAMQQLISIGREDYYFAGISLFDAGRSDIESRLGRIPSLLADLEIQNEFLLAVKNIQQGAEMLSLAGLSELSSELARLHRQEAEDLSFLKRSFPDSGAEQLFSRLREDRQLISALEKDIIHADEELASIPEHWQHAVLQILSEQKDFQLNELDRQWTNCWITELENRYSCLRLPASWYHQQIDSLQVAIVKKRKLAGDILCLKLGEATHKDLVRNRLQNRVSYRGLFHQVSKKRQRLPLRTLWQSFGDDILKLIPVWLATPESVSATWSMDMKFDLVIFDEASQCFAEKGIPAIARGGQVVVLGDGKQLPPNHLFNTRWEEESAPDDAPLSEQESLLDLARQFFPSRMLTGHYRSRFPELIAFSNKHFYEGKLRMIPSPETLQGRKPAVRYVQLQGSWENRRNREEASWIALEALRFFSEERQKTLGIITFNVSQQECIEEEILSLCLERLIEIPDWFFVKNIENVQGDERDYIWFSLAYAPGAGGNMLSQFGLLSQEGGENRLNVAISRAKYGITVVSSLHAAEWSFALKLARGPALLAAYVQFIQQVSSVEVVEKETSRGSLMHFCDHIEMEGDAACTLVFQDLKKLYPLKSMKTHFGLNPVFFRQTGYQSSFEYWEMF